MLNPKKGTTLKMLPVVSTKLIAINTIQHDNHCMSSSMANVSIALNDMHAGQAKNDKSDINLNLLTLHRNAKIEASSAPRNFTLDHPI